MIQTLSDWTWRLLGNLIFAPAVPERFQNVVQRIMRGPRQATVMLDRTHLFTCLTSEKYYWYRDSYEAEERRELEANLGPDSVLFDIGAHAGFWEVILAPRCRHIHAFEPSPLNFARLRLNISQNNIENVSPIAVAASDRTGVVRLFEDGSRSHVGEQGVETHSIRLDDYVARHEPPTVVKIDIEGHAGAALAGMRETLSRYRPAILLELHDDQEITACLGAVAGLGYDFLRLGAKNAYPYRAKLVRPV